MFKQQPMGVQSLLKDGGKSFSGVDEALLKNIEACKDLAKIIRSSFGPNGSNKLVINHLGRQFITADTATMLKELDMQHPCGRMLVASCAQQEFEVGDGTNLTVMFAGSLLQEAEALLKEGLHAADVIKGYELCLEKTLELIGGYGCWELTDVKDFDQVKKAVMTAVSAKQMDLAPVLTDLIAKAIVQVTRSLAESQNDGKKGIEETKKFELDNVRTSKIPGGSLSKSFVVDGMVVPRNTMGIVKEATKCKVAVYGGGIDHQQTEAKGTVLIKNAAELMNFSKGEESAMEEFIKGLADMGVGVIISGGSVNDIAQHFLDKYKILTVKIGSKFELKRMCSSLKAVNVLRAGLPMEEELGYADSVKVEEIASNKITVFRSEESKIATIVLRGATLSTLEEWDRAINDAVNVIRAAIKEPTFCAGGSATEMRLAHDINTFGATVPGLDQYAVLKFAEALEMVPKILADNAGYSRVDTLTALYKAQADGKHTTGLDLSPDTEEILQDSAKVGVLDHLSTKEWAIRHALESVLTILRVDHIIMAKQAGQKQQ